MYVYVSEIVCFCLDVGLARIGDRLENPSTSRYLDFFGNSFFRIFLVSRSPGIRACKGIIIHSNYARMYNNTE